MCLRYISALSRRTDSSLSDYIPGYVIYFL